MFSPFRSLRSLSKPGMYLFFSFWQIAVTFRSGSVSFFLLLADCSHFRIRECIFFSPFHYLRSLSEPGMHLFFFFSRFAVTSGSRKCISFSPFRDLQSLFRTGIASAFLLLVICSHILTPEVYLIFSFSQSAVTLVPENSAESLPNNKNSSKRRFSRSMLLFLDSKKDSGISCLFWRRYFFLWGVAKTI